MSLFKNMIVLDAQFKADR